MSNSHKRIDGALDKPPYGDMVLLFGRHERKTLEEVWETHPEWIEWAAKHLSFPEARNRVKEFLMWHDDGAFWEA